MKKNIADLWEKRSKLFRDSKKAVMEQAFPLVVNNHIEQIHIKEVERIIGPRVQKCLDVGCGYGRVAKVIANRYRKVFIYGVDVAPTFVRLFNSRLQKRGRAVVGDIRKLPFQDNSFDAIWVVVSFMYLENKEDQQKGMRELFRVLKPGGKVLLIEPNSLGVNILRLWGLMPLLYRTILGRSKVETYGISFPFGRIDSVLKTSGGQLIYKRGYPVLTLLLLPCIVLGRFMPYLARFMLFFIKKIDRHVTNSYFSYFISYAAVKK